MSGVDDSGRVKRRMDSGIPSLAPSRPRTSQNRGPDDSIPMSRGIDDGMPSLPPPTSRSYDPSPQEVSKEEDSTRLANDVDQDMVLSTQGDHLPEEEEDIESNEIVEEKAQQPIKIGNRFTRRTKIMFAALLLLVVAVAVVVPVLLIGNDDDTSDPAPAPTDLPGNTSTLDPSPPGTDPPGTDPPGTDPPGTAPPTSSPGFVVPNSVTALDENLLRLAVTSARLCVDVNQNNTEELQPTAAVFTDEPDKSMVVQVENVCFGVFRATSGTTNDWLQNLNQRLANNVCSNLTGECCTSFVGYRNGYTTSFQTEFEEAMYQCKDNCPDCEVVLTGTSQGAAVAHVAAVFLDDLDPAVLNFGQPRTLEAPCNPINRSRMFRFINTIVFEDQLLYDSVPFLASRGNPVHMGHLFVLGEDIQNLAYFPDGEAPNVGFGDIAIRNVADAHLLVHYLARLETLWNSSTLPVSIDGFAIGEKCTRGSECVAPQICGFGVCTEGNNGDPCSTDEHCLAGVCVEAQCAEEDTGAMSDTFFVPSMITELDFDFLSLSLQAANLSVALAAEDTEALLPDASVFLDEPDEALVMKQNNTCFVVFRGTTPSLDDWRQNLDPGTAMDVCSTTGKCCTTRAGFRDAYVNTTYRASLEAAARQCVQDCPECEVVFTGPSQGGAVALVAAIFMDDLKPSLITHGQPPAVEAPCDVLDTSRYYRFVNTVVRNDDLRFDPVPFLHDAFGNTDDFGHLIIMGEDLENVAYYPDGGEYPDIGLTDFAIQSLLEVHLPFRYRDRLLSIAAEGKFPLQIGGWAISQKCSLGSQCVSPNICGRGQCTEGAVGDPCGNDEDCVFSSCGFFRNECFRNDEP